MVESTWAEDMGQFLYHLDPDTRKIIRSLEKTKSKMINCVPLSLTKFTWTYIYIIRVLVVTKSLCGFVLNQVQCNMESAQYLG